MRMLWPAFTVIQINDQTATRQDRADKQRIRDERRQVHGNEGKAAQQEGYQMYRHNRLIGRQTDCNKTVIRMTTIR